MEESLAVTVARGRYKELVATTNVMQPVIAPIAAGQQLGEVEIRLGDELIAKQPLIALQSVDEGSWWRQLLDTILMWIWG